MAVFKPVGTGVALVTPFHKDGSIDFKGFEKLIEHVIAGKVDYLVPLGTTGESVTLSKDEKTAVVDFVVETASKRIPIVLGMGGNNTRELIDTLGKGDFNGVSAILSVAPYYNKPTQKGLYEHYKSVALSSPVPVILYNVPGRTGSNMTAETTVSLANDFENIIAVKEASGNFEQIMQIMKDKPTSFDLISGDDNLILPMASLGATGVISVAANAFPQQIAEMTKFATKGSMEKARNLHYKLLEMIKLLFIEGNPAGIKQVLSDIEICNNHVRLPLVTASKALQNKLAAATVDL